MKPWILALSLLCYSSLCLAEKPATSNIKMEITDAMFLIGKIGKIDKIYVCNWKIAIDLGNPPKKPEDAISPDCRELKEESKSRFSVRDGVELRLSKKGGVQHCVANDKKGMVCGKMWTNTASTRDLGDLVPKMRGIPYYSPEMKDMIEMANPGMTKPEPAKPEQPQGI